MSFKDYLKEKLINESEWLDREPIKYGRTDIELSIYKDPYQEELAKIYRDRQGEGGCRIGIDSMNVVYCWIDNVDHDYIERNFKLKFVNGKFSHPSPRANSVYISGEGAAKSFSERLNNKDYMTTLKKLFRIFQDVKYVKSEVGDQLFPIEK